MSLPHLKATVYDIYVQGRNWLYDRKSIVPVSLSLPLVGHSNLWLGDQTCGPHYPEFDCIIDCTPDLDLQGPHSPQSFYRVPLGDVHTSDPKEYWHNQKEMLGQMQRMVPVITDRIRRGQRVLVHCRGGQQRSAALVAAYLVASEQMDCDSAINELRKFPGTFYPDCNFRWALIQFSQLKRSL